MDPPLPRGPGDAGRWGRSEAPGGRRPRPARGWPSAPCLNAQASSDLTEPLECEPRPMTDSDALVVFTPSGKRGRFALGTPLLQAARSLGVDVDSVCGGRA